MARKNEQQRNDFKDYITYMYSMDDIDCGNTYEMNEDEEEIENEESDWPKNDKDFIEKDTQKKKNNIQFLTKKQESILAGRIRQGDNNAKEELAAAFDPLLKRIIREYRNLGLPEEDLYQEGYYGLLCATERFDPEKGRFSKYAESWMRKFIMKALDHEQAFHISDKDSGMLTKLFKFQKQYEMEHGRKPSDEEIADALKIPKKFDEVHKEGYKEKISRYRQMLQDVISIDMDKSEDEREDLETVLNVRVPFSVEETAIQNNMEMDMTDIIEYMKSLHFDDKKEELVLHIICNEFDKRSINSILEKAGITMEEYEKIEDRIYNRIKRAIRSGSYIMRENDEEDIYEYREELKDVSSGRTTQLIEEQNRMAGNLMAIQQSEWDCPEICWEMNAFSFFGSKREHLFLKQVEKIKSVNCQQYVMRYLKKIYKAKNEDVCLKYLQEDYKKSGIKVKNKKDYFKELLHDLNEKKLNEMALATHMSLKSYSIFRKKVLKCSETDFAKKDYIFMYLTLKYAVSCGELNYKKAYDGLSSLYSHVSVKANPGAVTENLFDSSRVIGNEILFYLEDINQLKSKYIDKLFVEKIEKLEEIIRKTEVIKTQKLMRSSEELFHNQWKELRENIVQYDRDEFLNEHNLNRSMEFELEKQTELARLEIKADKLDEKEYKKLKEKLENTYFEKSETLNIDRPYIRRVLYGMMYPDKDYACQIGKASSFLNSDEFLNTLIADNNVITQFATRPEKMKRNLLLTLLFANYCYRLMNSTKISNSYEERLAYFEDKVYRELSVCGYMGLNSENAYDAYLKLLLTCAQPLELFRYIWMRKLDEPMWDYCIDDPERYMNS